MLVKTGSQQRYAKATRAVILKVKLHSITQNVVRVTLQYKLVLVVLLRFLEDCKVSNGQPIDGIWCGTSFYDTAVCRTAVLFYL